MEEQNRLPRLETAPAQRTQDPEEKRAVYVGNLPSGVTESNLREIFSISGSVHSIKLIGKSSISMSTIYAFVEYDDPASAQNAIETFNGKHTSRPSDAQLTTPGRTIFDSPIKVNWAYQSTSSATAREENSSHYTIFVGDLATEVNDEALLHAFSRYASVSDARVMWDMTSGRSRGYGFVSFAERHDAEKALAEMPGTWLGSRSIRCNWANQKQVTPTSPSHGVTVPPLDIAQQYAIVAGQAPYHVSTIYVGNLAADTAAEDLAPLFESYGEALDIKMRSERGFAFVKLDSHDTAALAIVQLGGIIVKGRPIKCSWQMKADAHNRHRSVSAAASIPLAPHVHVPQYQMYSAPTPHVDQIPMIPRQVLAPPQVMTPEQLIAVQVHQQQQALARMSLQMASMSQNANRF